MESIAVDVAQIRAGIPALSECIYLNTGTFGPLPRAVTDEIRRVYGQVERLGTFSPLVFFEMELQGLEKTRKKVAALIHATPAEIAFTHNVTDGINIVLHGLDWSQGDQVVISTHEHPAGTIPWLALAERRGITVRQLPVSCDPDRMVSRFESLLGPRTRLACLSHVSCLNGLRLPVQRLCTVARDAGVLTLIDGAHAEGQFPVDVPGLGADFYAACGHKWLLGPQGTGFLYVRRAHLENVRPAWLGWGVNKHLDRRAMRYELEPTAARFEASTQAWPLYLALGRAIDHIQNTGLGNIETRVRQLVDHFRALLARIPGLKFHTPAEPAQSSGLITCSLPGWEAEALSKHLWESQRILTNFVRDLNGVRFSIAFFNTIEELETVAAALAAAADSARDSA